MLGACSGVLKRVMLALAMVAAATPASGGMARCTGDCDDDKSVGIAELITMVNVALGHSELAVCLNGDRDGDGSIEIDELVTGVSHALDGCEGDIEPKPYKTFIDHPSEPYLAFPATQDSPSWVKFTIRVADPTVVYFQNSSQTPLHHDFVAATLEPYIGWTPSQIDAVSLHADGQELVFGAVLYSPTTPHEIAIQLVRQDPYTLDEVITYFTVVRNAVRAASGVPFFYFPTFEQQQTAAEQRDQLAAAGIPLGSTARWARGDACYAFGWAHGRIVSVAPEDIEDAYAEGTLRPEDILLTDGVPAHIPFVAGVLSLAPATPSSHVAILAGDWQIPFAYLSRPESIEAAQALVGRTVVLRATTLTPQFYTGTDVDLTACQVRLVDVTDALEESVAQHLRDLKRAPDLAIRPFVLTGGYTAEVDTATPDDIVKIGGKAANYGFLRRTIPQNARIGIAFTFDLWNDYLDQPIDGGATLRARIAELLAPFPTYPPADFAALYDALDEIRDLIDDEADFTPAQRSVILAALDRFNPLLPIRFRSSTNVEDSDVFTGAGLYDSESGCFADEVDDDEEGPSRCDATRENERGVFRALRKVFLSFYNDNAFVERLRHRVDESTVGMAVLVHHTFTDDTELANGVATLRVLGPETAAVTIVSQPGAFSVTEPEDGSLPEVVEVYVYGDSVIPTVRQGADRVPLGATVLQMPAEYVTLSMFLVAVGDAFGEFHGETTFDIEFEYKKIVGEGLDVKQVRRIPASTASDTDPVLIHAPVELCTLQGEYSDVFANYRLKSRWQPRFSNGPVDEAGSGVFSTAAHDYVLDGSVLTLEGAPSSWPDASHGTFDPELPGVFGLRTSWRVGTAAAGRMLTLKTLVPRSVGPAPIPVIFPEDLGFVLEAEVASPVPYLHYDNSLAKRTVEGTALQRCLDQRPLTPLHLEQTRTFASDGAAIESNFYWPPMPTGAVAGYTAPVDRWVGTTVSGVVSASFTLDGYFSQTYRPEHHNFAERFIFDPHLEDDISPATLAEWDARGIQALVLEEGFQDIQRALTADGQIVELSTLP